MMSTQHRQHGRHLLKLIQHGGLIVICIATLIAVTQEVMKMAAAGHVTLADLLMLFLYLEVIAMVGIYLDSGKLPVRMPLYIAIVALARYLALGMEGIDNLKIITVAGAILAIAVAVLVIRYGQIRFPYPPGGTKDSGDSDANIN